MADGTVNIDVILNSQQAKGNVKELDELLKNVGQGAGDQAEKSLQDSKNKAVEDTKSAQQKNDDE